MKQAAYKSPEEHLQYLRGSVRLMLWFCHRWASDHPGEDFIRILEDRVDIFEKTDLHKGLLYAGDSAPKGDPVWDTLMREVKAVKEALPPGDHDGFEQKAFELVSPLIKDRVGRDVEALRELSESEESRNGPFWWDRKLMDGEAKAINFHIYNSCYPGSIFDDPEYLPRFFIRMMDRSEREMGAKSLSTMTWMNNLNRWLNCFPPEWRGCLSEPDGNVMGHLGFWGQIITSRHTLNPAFDARIRQTGMLPYLMRRSYCSFGSMRDHLKKEYGLSPDG
jgi:hypothetical protein